IQASGGRDGWYGKLTALPAKLRVMTGSALNTTKTAAAMEAGVSPVSGSTTTATAMEAGVSSRAGSTTMPAVIKVGGSLGAGSTTAAAIEVGGSPKPGFRARLGAKLKLMLEWMREHLSYFLR
ncbi:MAG: hypothetical protein J2P31_00135, partial [Blastocatellia bacterium]|nr:hypothetical protein [Blastocatellia bacterium]